MIKWEEKMLGELVLSSKGKLTKQSEFPEDGYLPLINADAINGRETIYSNPKGAVLCEEDDVLMLWDGERSGLVTFGFKGVVGSTFAKLKTLEELDSKYLFYYLNEKFLWIQNNRTGTGVPHVPKDLERILLVKYPKDKTEQRQIATILSTADAVIEKTQAAIAKYKAIKQGMLQDLFTRGIDTTTGKLRQSYQDAPELYKESKLGWIPKKWENCEMGKYISDNLYGPRFNAKDYHINGNVKTIRGTDFTKDGEILYNKAPKAQLDSSLINSHKLEDGDIVIVTTADCGLTAVFKKPINDVDFIPSAYSVKYRFMKNVNPYFIKYFMTTDLAIRQVNKYIRQGTLGNLPGSDILGFNMIYPSTDEQNKVAERLLAIDNKIQTEQDFLHKHQQIKAGLMHDLLSGKKKLTIKENKMA